MNRPIGISSDVSPFVTAALSSLPVSFALGAEHPDAVIVEGGEGWAGEARRALDSQLPVIVLQPGMADPAGILSLAQEADAGGLSCVVVPRWSADRVRSADLKLGEPEWIDIRVVGARQEVGSEATFLLQVCQLIGSLELRTPMSWSLTSGASGSVAIAPLSGALCGVTATYLASSILPAGVLVRRASSAGVLELQLPLDAIGVPSRTRLVEPSRIVERPADYESSVRRGLVHASAVLTSDVLVNHLHDLARLARIVELAAG